MMPLFSGLGVFFLSLSSEASDYFNYRRKNTTKFCYFYVFEVKINLLFTASVIPGVKHD